MTLDFMCACETYVRILLITSYLSHHSIHRFRRTGVIVRPAADGSVQVEEVPCYGIASVFTPAPKRGKGYAGQMMRLLHWILAPTSSFATDFPGEWGSPPVARLQDARFSILYSDVGSEFYHNSGPTPNKGHGWVATGMENTSWNVDNIQSQGRSEERCRWLQQEDAVRVWEQDAELMKQDARSYADKTHTIVFSLLPNQSVGVFTIQRLMTFTSNLVPNLPSDIWGVQLLDNCEQQDSLAFATWTLESGKPKIMVLTRLRATRSSFAVLLRKLMERAKDTGIETIECWNLPEQLRDMAMELGGRTFLRDDHLSSVKWYGPETEDTVRWLFNEKSVMPFIYVSGLTVAFNLGSAGVKAT